MIRKREKERISQLSECCTAVRSSIYSQPPPPAFPSTSPRSGPSLISDWGVVIYQIQTDKSFIKSRSRHVNSRREVGGGGVGIPCHGGGRCSIAAGEEKEKTHAGKKKEQKSRKEELGKIRRRETMDRAKVHVRSKKILAFS